MNKDIKLILEDGHVLNVERGITVAEVLDKINDNSVIGIRVNGKAVPTNYEIMNDSVIKYLDINDRVGRKIYIKGLQFMYLLAVYELYGNCSCVKIKHSIDKAIYTEIKMRRPITSEVVKEIKDKMKEISSKDLSIKKISSSRDEALDYYEKLGEEEKVLNYTYMTSEYVSLYELGDIYNYFYYIMPVSTGVLNRFDLTYIEPNGIILSYPVNNEVPKYNPAPKVLESFRSYEERLSKLNINYAGDVNKIVTEGNIKDYIQTNELMYEELVDDIAKKVVTNRKIKAIFMSGPSSSGKTTSSRKLSLCLKAKGIDALVISTDDYFLEREKSPKDESGNYDFERVEALDYDLFRNHIKKLLMGEEIIIPTYNFIAGQKEFKRKPIALKEKQVLIVEGLHAVSEKLNGSIAKQNKLTIYLSPFTPISLDRHNHISTTDVRLLRRMVRDFNHRGYSAEATLNSWLRMRASEEKNVYPYQRETDIILNTSLSYEIGVLRTYAEPLLYSVNSDSPVYEEAIMILNFLKGFINIPSEDIPSTSILREFIGNSYFE